MTQAEFVAEIRKVLVGIAPQATALCVDETTRLIETLAHCYGLDIAGKAIDRAFAKAAA